MSNGDQWLVMFYTGISGDNEFRHELAFAMSGSGAAQHIWWTCAKGLEGLAYANNTCMHSFTTQYVAQRGAMFKDQTRQLSTQEVGCVIPGRLVIFGRGRTRTRFRELTCQT